jgi:triacylglycerol esterase/lipase EstA (alpha/beta hydrolase family)
MLSRLLRAVVLGQLLIGALLGALVVWLAGVSPYWISVAALLALLLGTPLSISFSAISSRQPGSDPLLWWRSYVSEMLCSTRMFTFRMPFRWSRPSVQPGLGSAQRIPVVLVHGFLCNHHVLDDVALALRRAGHTVLGVDLEPLFTSIDGYAPRIEQAVQQLCSHTGAQKVALLGHSMGGLAIRAWLRAHGGERAARVVTLGTPHWGTRIGQHVRTPNGQQMGYRSAWLQQLAAQELPELRQRMAIAVSPQDNIVYPQLEQVLEGAEVRVFPGRGHVQLCRDGEVNAWLTAQLANLG